MIHPAKASATNNSRQNRYAQSHLRRLYDIADNGDMSGLVYTADDLVASLDALGVHFLTGGIQSDHPPTISATDLLAALIAQSDARMRLAIIPLLLRRPELAACMPDAIERTTDVLRQQLKLYYTAAMVLQQEYRNTLQRLLGAQPSLLDLYGGELGIVRTESTQAALEKVAAQHAACTGLSVNWAGTYRHAAQRIIKRLEHEAQWALPERV